MSNPIIHQQIEFLLKKITEQHGQMRQKQGSVPQADMDAIIQNLRQLYEAALILYQQNTFAALDEMHAAAAEQQMLAEKRAAELRHSLSAKPQEEAKPAAMEEVAVPLPSSEETKTEIPKPAKKSVSGNATLFEDMQTVGRQFGSEETLHKKIAGKSTEETVAHKHHHKPVTDLKAAIGINEKFLFINKLFDGNSTEYNLAIERINNSGSLSAAGQIIDGELLPKYNWEKASAPVKEFMELVERRFVS
jgi:hypothetical protein